MDTHSKIAERIKLVEEEIRTTPYHKGTEHHIGLLRAKLAKLRNELYGERKKRGGGERFALRKHGDATVALIGPPSVGKSTLINRLTNAFSPVGKYDFTTTTVVPGMMSLKGAKIQLFDLPGLIEGSFLGRGGGKQILSAARAADLLLLVSDFSRRKKLFGLIEDLKKAGFRLNQLPPKIEIRKTLRGGIRVIDPFVSVSQETVKAIVSEFGVKNGEVIFKEALGDINRLIDVLCGNRVYVPAAVVINKIDVLSEKERKIVEKELRLFWKGEIVFISAEKSQGLEELKKLIWRKLALIRVYLRRQEASSSRSDPLVIPRGTTIRMLVEKINSNWLTSLKGALVWGKKVKFAGQKVSLNYILVEGDTVYLLR